MPTLDDELVEWVVGSGDPASKAIARLRRHGFDTVVLPRAVYLGYTGNIREMPEADDKQLVFRLREIECMTILTGA